MTTKNYSKSRKSRIKKQSDDKIIKATKDRIIRDIRNFLNKKNKIINKPLRVGYFLNDDCIENKKNGET